MSSTSHNQINPNMYPLHHVLHLIIITKPSHIHKSKNIDNDNDNDMNTMILGSKSHIYISNNVSVQKNERYSNVSIKNDTKWC